MINICNRSDSVLSDKQLGIRKLKKTFGKVKEISNSILMTLSIVTVTTTIGLGQNDHIADGDSLITINNYDPDSMKLHAYRDSLYRYQETKKAIDYIELTGFTKSHQRVKDKYRPKILWANEFIQQYSQSMFDSLVNGETTIPPSVFLWELADGKYHCFPNYPKPKDRIIRVVPNNPSFVVTKYASNKNVSNSEFYGMPNGEMYLYDTLIAKFPSLGNPAIFRINFHKNPPKTQ